MPEERPNLFESTLRDHHAQLGTTQKRFLSLSLQILQHALSLHSGCLSIIHVVQGCLDNISATAWSFRSGTNFT